MPQIRLVEITEEPEELVKWAALQLGVMIDTPTADRLRDAAFSSNTLTTAPTLITREDLRYEMAALRQTLRDDIAKISTESQTGLKDDIRKMITDLQQSLPASDTSCEQRKGLLTPPEGRPRPTSPRPVKTPIPPAGPIRHMRDEADVMPGALPAPVKSEDQSPAIGFIEKEKDVDRLITAVSTDNASMDPMSSSKTVKSTRRTISAHRKQVRTSGTHMKLDLSFVQLTSCSGCQHTLSAIVAHPHFDYIVTALIVLNGIMVGVQTDVMARATTDDSPVVFEVLEVIFCVIFTTELCFRLGAHGWKFFTMSGKGWNYFDLVIVSLQLFEMTMAVVASGLGFKFTLLRILRLVRVIRLARALRLIGELRTIVASIAGSMKPLFWTGVLLFMVVYVLGVYITQVVLNERIEMEKDGRDDGRLERFWGDLFRSIFSLFESITGGVDWDDVVRPLWEQVGSGMVVLYCLYIAFTVLAMLNVVTGVFIESVMKNATAEKEQNTINHLNSLFSKLDVSRHGELTWEDFQRQLETKEMREFFRTIDVDIKHARALFDLLDMDESGSVNAEEFMDGCLQIWAPSKGLDFHMMRRDVNRLGNVIRDDKTTRALLVAQVNGSEPGSHYPGLPYLGPQNQRHSRCARRHTDDDQSAEISSLGDRDPMGKRNTWSAGS